jgi:phosphoribosylformylglycinamidine synthase
MHGRIAGRPPALDLQKEAALQRLIVQLIRDQQVESAHDCSEGGLAIALAECTFDTGGIGVSVDLTPALSEPAVGERLRVEGTLFGESASRIVMSATERNVDVVLAAAKAGGISAARIGTTGGDRIRISVGSQVAIDSAVTEAETAWATAIENKMRRAPGTRNP